MVLLPYLLRPVGRRIVTNVGPTGFRFTPDKLPLIQAAVNMRRSDGEIGKLLGCDRTTVQKIRLRHGIKQDLSSLVDITAKVSKLGLNLLDQEADRRNTTPQELVGRLIEAIASGPHGGLFSAILDD